jgi:HAE1 family hydrophobic/amphiphilic exporter-1
MAAAGLRHRLETLMLGGGLALLVVFAYRGIPKRDTQAEGPRRLEMHLRLPQNFTLREANDAFARVEKVVLDRKEELRVRSVTSWFSSDGGEINIFLEEGERVEEDAFFARLRPLLPRLPGVTYRLGFEDFAREDGGKRLRVFIRGNDLRRLAEIGASVRSELENRERFPELQEVDEWSEEEEEEIRVDVLRRVAQEYGIDTGTVSRMVAWALRGAPLPDFNLADRELPFWIAYAGGPKENIEEINAVRVFDRDGRAFRLENLIERPAVLPGMGEIHRVNGKMTIGFSASIDQGEAGEAGAQAVRARVEERLKRLALPEGFEISMRAELGGFDMDFKNAALAATMSFLLVFFVMGLLFESFILPLSVLCSIPFAFCGSIILLWALSVSLDMVGMIGMVMLLGIVVNNAIVLVDYVNRVRREGLDRDLALIQAVEVRFRPIWMTALTTVFGLLPLMVLPQRGEGVDYQPLAVVLVGGLTVSTFFTLVYVPVLYTLLDDLREWLLGFFGARPREEETPGHGAS